MLSDIEIARNSKVEHIKKIASKINIDESYIEYYGNDKAKVNLSILKNEPKENSKLILVTAITPTPLGEGKSTTSIGLVDALNKLNYQCCGALREPSLGPVFGVKGGAAGGGYAQINPMADINLHFTGDLHAITAANNLISACLDNHIYQGNALQIDEKRIIWKRCVDLNDRALRKVRVALDSSKETPRDDAYNITVASEIMAILCLAKDVFDLRQRIARLLVAYNTLGQEVTVNDLGITGSVLVLLKDAIKPNLVQTLENNPVFVHGGPFANIAHGCNSIIATKMALSLSDYVVTEAGFGADLGCEKFIDIKCREAGLAPSCIVLVATIKALKYHGGVNKKDVNKENVCCMLDGISNLRKHIDTLNYMGIPYVVALNRYQTDTDNELKAFDDYAKANNIPYELSEVFAKGSIGGLNLAKKVVELATNPVTPNYVYELNDETVVKITKICKIVYGARDVFFEDSALATLKSLNKEEFKDYYICMAKTPLSLSDDAKVVGRPVNFTIHIREIRIAKGSKFIICLTGEVMTMPGLPKTPLANKIDLDDDGNIINLS